jgi:hypothetical protein
MPATWISKEKIQTIWGMLHNIRIRMQENIKTPAVTVSGSGLRAAVNIDLPKLGSGGDEDPDAVPCKITGGNSTDGYTVTIYADGRSQPATGTGTLDVLELLWQDEIPVGTWVIGHESTVQITGEPA